MKASRSTGVERKPRARQTRSQSSAIGIKRVYDKPARNDGVRIFVDRLWPRGLSKAALAFDAWPRELAPSTELRTWYGHDALRFAEFSGRYRDELAACGEELAALRAMIKGRTATLITATRDLDLSHAQVLREVLEGRRRR